jgi:3-hydroxybutyryl-CoA dehydratase
MAFKVGDKKKITEVITAKRVDLFAEMSGDYNPIHMDEEHAKKTRFGRRIAHGMISAALISRALAMELGPGGIYLAQEMKFLKPIFIGDTVDIELEVLKLNEKRGIGTISTIVRKVDTGEICVKGEATIMDGSNV